jgi:cardiolipin synthase
LWAWAFFLSEWGIRLAMLVVVPFRRMPAAAKGWLLLIFFEPWLGLLLYLLIGRAKLPRWRREQLAKLPQAMARVVGRLTNHPNVFHPEVDPPLSQAVALAEKLGGMPILGGNAVELLADYDGTIARLVADIDRAKNHVHLLFYLFADDHATAPVVEALGRAAARGVRCRVLADAIGSRAGLRTLRPRLAGLGVAVHAMLPVRLVPWKKARVDLRNHRKIAVIDGRVGYTGSQNLVAADFKGGIAYEDLMVRATGPVVLDLQYVFAADWFLETNEVLDGEAEFPCPEIAGDVPAQALASGPDFPTQNNQRLIVALVHGARKRVVLTTPYFIPDEPLLQALQTAALRGVDVHLVVSEKGDQLIVSLAQRSYYEELLEAGVHIHLYGRKFLHAKHLSVDDSLALIGTSNLDIRSFALNAEVMLMIYDSGLVARLSAEQERYFRSSRVLTLAAWRERPFGSKLAQNLARLLSPSCEHGDRKERDLCSPAQGGSPLLSSASGRPVSENVAIGEQRRCPAGMPEDDLVTGVEPSKAEQGEQRGHRLAGVNRVEQQAFEVGGALHGVDHLVGRYPVPGADGLIGHGKPIGGRFHLPAEQTQHWPRQPGREGGA